MNPEPGIPMVCITASINWKKNTKKNTIKLKDESDLKALYAGRNQQRYENGVNSKVYKIPNPIIEKSIIIIPPRIFDNITIP